MSIRRSAAVRKGALAMVLLGAFAGSSPVWAQGTVMTAESPFRTISRENATPLTAGAFSVVAAESPRIVRVPEATWLQLEFGDFNLGRSVLRIRDLKTSQVQTFTQAQLEQWGGRTAMFNSDRLRISVDFAANERERVYYELRNIVAGEPSIGIQTNCGADDRAASTNPRVGRLVPVGCTAWIIGDNLFLTAGHCAGSRLTTLQFNVPTSNANGGLNSPPVQDQYSVVQSSIRSSNAGIGNDWAVFRVAPNTQTGLLPRQAQGVAGRAGSILNAAFPLSITRTTNQVRITGFGSDTGATNQTLQTHVGPNLQGGTNSMRYQVDTTGGNSGSPVFTVATATAPSVALGIHTNGGCSAQGTGANSGTSLRNLNLQNAIRSANDPGVRFTN